MKKAELKNRWSVGAGADFSKQLLGDIAHGCEIRSSPFGRHNDRIDLRGFVFPPKTSMRRVKMLNIELSAAMLNGVWIESCYFDNVSFDEVSAVKIADHGNHFVGCSFVGANLREAAIGYRGSRFQRVNFVEADFRRAIFIRPEFDDVTFVACRLESIDFNASSFCRSAFSGDLKDVWFRGGFAVPSDIEQFGSPRLNKMDGVSFERARLLGATFSDGCDLRTVTLPADGSCTFFDSWESRLERLQMFAGTQPDAVRNEIEIFCRSHLVHASGQKDYILSAQDVRADFGNRIASIILDMLSVE